MPMEASMNIGIRPASRPQSAGGTEGVSRREDGGGSSAAFSPKTNVSIQNAIDDMAGILSKISSNQADTVDKMPQELQKIIQNVLKQAFSLEETMGQGLGSTLESQRFSMDQLSALSRMLSQMGNMAEKGMPIEVSNEMRALLTNLKSMVSSENGSSFEPVLLTKMSFGLLDNKGFQELPQEVQNLLLALQPQGQTASAAPENSGNSLGFLKQLVQYFMPRPVSSAEMTQQGKNATPNTNTQGKAPEKEMAASQPQRQPGTTDAQTGQTMQGKLQNVAQQQRQLTMTKQTPVSNNQQTDQVQQSQQTAEKQASAGNTMGSQSTSNTQIGQQAAAQQKNPADAAYPNGKTTTEQAGDMAKDTDGQAKTAPQQTAMQQAKTQLMSQTMENTQQTMQMMKNLARLMLENTAVSSKDVMLLQNFVNGQSDTLSDKESKQLQQLIRLCQQNIPATVQQAAVQQNLPDLPRLWAFMQLCDMTFTRQMSARQLKRAGKDVAMLVLSMRSSLEGDSSVLPGQRSLNFMLPMYMGEESMYPSYIHVYDEKKTDHDTGKIKRETWLRLCVLTDNIGAVEITCRVYNDTQLDMRVFFSQTEIAGEFRQQAGALRDSLKDSVLQLKELKIRAADELSII